MNTASIQSFDRHSGQPVPPPPPYAVRVSGRTLDRACEALGLSANAEMPEIQAALDRLADDLRAKDGRTLVSVPRRGPLDALGKVQEAAPGLRSVPRRGAR
jgi:hypothetical protein